MRALAAGLAAALLGACTTMNVIEQPADEVEVFHQIQPGDTIVLYLKSGRHFTMDVDAVEKQALRGVWPHDGKTYRVSFDRIARVEREEVSADRTFLNIGRGALAVCVIGIVLLGIAL